MLSLKFESDRGKKSVGKRVALSSRHNKSMGIPIKFELEKVEELSDVIINNNEESLLIDDSSFNLSLFQKSQAKEDPLDDKLQHVLKTCKHLAKLLVLRKCVKIPENVSEINFLVEFFKKRVNQAKDGDSRALWLTKVISEIIEGLNFELQ